MSAKYRNKWSAILRWQEDVMEDLKKLKVKNWKDVAKDRTTGRDLAEKAKTHKGL